MRCRRDRGQVGIECRLHAYAGKPVGVLVRTASEKIAEVLKRNPFSGEAGHRTVAIFVDEPLRPDALEHATGQKAEKMSLGAREIFVFYVDGMADSRLRIPAAMACWMPSNSL
jgi:hypothetical protein